MLMILTTTLLLGSIGYLFYLSKKELSKSYDFLEKPKEDDDFYSDFGRSINIESLHKYLRTVFLD